MTEAMGFAYDVGDLSGDSKKMLHDIWKGVVDWMARDAEAVSNGIDLHPRDDGKARNAIAHAHESASIAREHGYDWAKVLGDLKEESPGVYTGTDQDGDEWKDQYNNEVGRLIAEWMEDNNLTESDINPATGQNYTEAELDAVMDKLIVDAHNNDKLLEAATEREIAAQMQTEGFEQQVAAQMQAEGINESSVNPATGQNWTAQEIEDEKQRRVKDGFKQRLDQARRNDDVPMDEFGNVLDPVQEARDDWNGPSAGWESLSVERDYEGTAPEYGARDWIGYAVFGPIMETTINNLIALYEGGADLADAIAQVAAEAADDLQDVLAALAIAAALAPVSPWAALAAVAFWAAWNSGSPLVLDLDGDGIELVSLVNSNVYWDIDQDGFAEAIGWVQADDGFLAIDANNDGIITDHSELFGSVAEDGFTDLRLLDSNSDNVINASDTAFADLLVWRDLNQNGFSEANELFSLSALNIVSINANATAVNQTNAGHDVSHVSTYTVDDGVSGPQNLAIVDVWFQYDDINSEFVDDYTLDLASLFTVNQRGYGTLPDLYVAASIDNDWTDPDSLLSLLTAFSGKTLEALLADDGSVLAEVEAIMLRWAGVDGVDPASRGHNVDARKLEFLEELFGQEFLQAGWLENPGGFAGDMLDKAFDIALDALTARLIAQGAGQSLFTGGTFYNPLTDSLDGVTGLNLDTLDAVLAMAQDASKVSDKVAFWKSVVNVIDQLVGVSNLSGSDQTALNAAIAASDSTLSTALILESLEWLSEVGGSYIGTSGNDTLSGTVGNDTFAGGHGADALSGGIGNDFLNGQSGDDILNGQSGDDELLGDSGSDTYLYFAGQGHDIFRENGSGTDRILFGPGITFADLTFTRISNSDLLIEVSEAAGGGAITIEQQFRSSDAGYIETLEFADSSTVSLNSLVHTLHGTNGADTLKGIRFGGSQNDTIYAYDGDDVIHGHSGTQDTGDNVIHAGDGNDQVFGGNGVDWIEGGNGNDLLKGNNGADTIDGGDGDDEIHGGSQADLLMGGAGADKLYADNDNDILSGGLGADELTGGTGADTFRFEAGSLDAVDTIKDLNTAHGDRIDIRDILEGFDPQTNDITDYVEITTSGSNSILAVDADGGGDTFIAIALILNKTGLTDEAALVASGHLLAA